MASELEVGKIKVNSAAPALRLNDTDSNAPFEARVEGTSFIINDVNNDRDLFTATTGHAITIGNGAGGNITLNTSADTLIPTGNVGIGDTVPNRNLCVKAAAASDGNISLKLNDATEWIFSHKVADGDLHIGNNAGTSVVEISQAGLATFANGIAVTTGGIQFPATQSASADANNLDDYQEGDFTPVMAFGGGSVGVTYSAQGQYGRYTRVGDQVHCNIRIVLTSKGTSTGAATISGLPFAPLNSYGNFSPASFKCTTVTFTDVPFAYTTRASTSLTLGASTEAGGTSNFSDANFADTSALMVSITYKAA